jgi:hypothetical protein
MQRRPNADGLSPRSDQGDVWRLVAEKSARFSVASETSAMSELIDNVGASLDDFVAACSPVCRRRGIEPVLRVSGRR